ncbi:MAG: bifunctional methylenetetrahydrofolate dehydrogenase/methenyltetrahydrofolate cyclohydrolase FolD [Deltaproteobacteria bacterium]|nr:bifunctional methylenetetrahydrofolate dehydrogenase/methenyltetrahydrofolate cyclohydrolase FolD [Deltaproteobacteria bacterium]
MAEILDGKSAAREVRERIRAETAELKRRHGLTPGLATVLVGEDPASKIYVGSKHKACEEVGFTSFAHPLPATTSESELLALIDRLNADERVHGILVQLPLPKGIDEKRVIFRLSPHKDVDGLHPVSQGRLLAGEPGLRPCTPLGVMHLVHKTGERLAGKRAVVIGRSLLVGKPVAMLLLEEHATVTICHSRTADLAGEIGRADVVVAAIGKAEMIRGAWIRPGSVVIDVGINRTDGGLKGDVEYAAARERAGFITPVPGGVGPMTVAMLMQNTLLAAERSLGTEPGPAAR